MKKGDEKNYFSKFLKWYEKFNWDNKDDPLVKKIKSIYDDFIKSPWDQSLPEKFNDLSILEKSWVFYLSGRIISHPLNRKELEGIFFEESRIDRRIDIFFAGKQIDNSLKLKSCYSYEDFFQAIFMLGFTMPINYFRVMKKYKQNAAQQKEKLCQTR